MLARTTLAILGSLMLLAGCQSGPTAGTSAEPSMVVYNAPPSIFRRDMGEDNRIQGDLIAWHADLAVDLDESAGGAGRATSAKVVGYCTGTMIVTLDARGGDDRQHRMTNIELDWDGSPDSLLVAGSHQYKQGQIETDTPIHRAIIGGTGRYAGAMGEMTSTRLPNGWYRHEIILVD